MSTTELTSAQRYAIDCVLDEFDFERVRRVMVFLDWTWWHDAETFRIPSIAEMRATARELLKSAEPNGSIGGTGGFMYKRDGDSFRLWFEIECSECGDT